MPTSTAIRLFHAFCVLVLLTGTAAATNGYFQVGSGPRARAVGGASIAFAQDALSIANNPSGIRLLDSGLDISLQVFLPDRGASFDTTGILGGPVTVDSENPFFLVPNFGVSWQLSDTLSVGISAYAAGGMNTEYKTNIFHTAFKKPIGIFTNAVAPSKGVAGGSPEQIAVAEQMANAPNTGTIGINLEQLIIAPSIAYGVSDNFDLGFSFLLGAQRFAAQGLGDFAGFSSDSSSLTNNGNSYAVGAGARIGLSYRPTNWLSLGASVASKVYMTKFDKYAGLFAEQGGFDIPANFGLGVAVRPIKGLTLTTDVTRILYEGVASVGNKGPTADQFLSGFNQILGNAFDAQITGQPVPLSKGISHQLGNDDGYGFGWQDIWVIKLGAAYDVTDQFSVMAGYNYGQNPVTESEALFNILAPAVVQHHYSAGAAYGINAHHELALTYMYVQEGTVEGRFKAGPKAAEALTGTSTFKLGYEATNRMSQSIVELGYRHLF